MTEPEPIRRTAPPLTGRAIASQRWSDLTFLHWRVDPTEVSPLLPPGVTPDEFDGASWVGLIPFLLDRATLFGSPPVPYVGRFVEINVRLYGVDAAGRRGVVFRSLEASRLAAVLATRAVFGLPYFWSRTTMDADGDVIRYGSRRHGGGPASRIVARPGALVDANPLADFLTARWGMFTARGGRGFCRTSTIPGRFTRPSCSISTTSSSPQRGCRASPSARRTRCCSLRA